MTQSAEVPARTGVRAERRGCDRGMTTAEYAVGTVAVVGGVGVLVAMLAEPSAMLKVFWPLIEGLVRIVLTAFGIRLS